MVSAWFITDHTEGIITLLDILTTGLITIITEEPMPKWVIIITIARITIGAARFIEMIGGWLPEQIIPEEAMVTGQVSQ